MSEYSSLKATINANIKANNNHEITGAITNSVLNAMVNSLGAGYQFIGVATPTNPGSDQSPDYKCFYLATTPGTYSHLGGLVVADGEVALLKWDTTWTKEVTGIATAAEVSQLGQYVENPKWVKVVTDNDGKILYGVKTDGKFYFGDGCPPQVQKYVNEHLEEITVEINTKVDKVTGKSLIDAEFASSQEVIDNPEWIIVTTDSEGKVLEGITEDGKKKVMLETTFKGKTIEEIASGAFGNKSTLDKFSEQSGKLLWNGVPIEGSSISTLVVDLPVSDGTGIESGYAYIDIADRTIKVKE